MLDEEAKVGSDLSCADFQTPTFLESFPIPLFPGEDALWTPGPKSSWGFFFKPDSWAWGFRGLFNASFGVESSDPEFVVKGQACARGQVRAAVNAKKAALRLSGVWVSSKRSNAKVRALAVPGVPRPEPDRPGWRLSL